MNPNALSNHQPADVHSRDCSTGSAWPNADTPKTTATMKQTVSPTTLAPNSTIHGLAFVCNISDKRPRTPLRDFAHAA